MSAQMLPGSAHCFRRTTMWTLVLVLAAAANASAQPTAAKVPAGNKPSEAAAEPTDFANESEWLAAPTRFAMCSALSPDETWVATGYGRWTDAGQVRVWNAATGKSIWHAREERGVRSVVISPDGSLVA